MRHMMSEVKVGAHYMGQEQETKKIVRRKVMNVSNLFWVIILVVEMVGFISSCQKMEREFHRLVSWPQLKLK